MAAHKGATVAQWILGLGVWAWLTALIFAPDLLRPLCGLICHQRAERSFFIDGVQLPVCARCTGLYVGAALAVPLIWVARSDLAAQRARLVLGAAALPTAITWTIEFAGVSGLSNTTRFVAALPLGLAAAWLVLGVLGPRASVIGPE